MIDYKFISQFDLFSSVKRDFCSYIRFHPIFLPFSVYLSLFLSLSRIIHIVLYYTFESIIHVNAKKKTM